MAIGMDVMVGFPGEDETAFNRTLQLIEDLPVAYLHVFPIRKGLEQLHPCYRARSEKQTKRYALNNCDALEKRRERLLPKSLSEKSWPS